LNRRKRIAFPYYFSPDRKLFQIVVRMSDSPGSFSSVLDALKDRVNLLGTVTYTLRDGSAIFNGFAEALVPSMSREDIEKALKSSRAVVETEVGEGSDGILVDTFHSGIEVQGDGMVMMRRDSLSRMMSRVNKVLGSGGEALLFEEGKAMGAANAENLARVLGKEKVKQNKERLRGVLSALGMGVVESKGEPGKGETTVVVCDCFECADTETPRRSCSFFRGYLVGSVSATYGEEFQGTETKCTLRGDDACEFTLLSLD
jgi:predicted hydrocarbon binding protein